MGASAGEGFSTATDIAEYLVRKGIPFRSAHEITGRIVLYCIDSNKDLKSLTMDRLQKFSPVIGNDIYVILDPAESVKARSSYGGTSPSEVKRQIRTYKKILG